MRVQSKMNDHTIKYKCFEQKKIKRRLVYCIPTGCENQDRTE